MAFLRFEEIDGGERKTKLFAVVGNQGDHLLGEVKWFARWRRYAFFPEQSSIFDASCLNEISGFIERQMEERTLQRRIAEDPNQKCGKPFYSGSCHLRIGHPGDCQPICL